MAAVYEIEIRRESGDLDTLILCGDCRASINDYAMIIRSRRVAGNCERCGVGTAPRRKGELRHESPKRAARRIKRALDAEAGSRAVADRIRDLDRGGR